MPGTSAQPLHKGWCDRPEFEPFTPRPQSSYKRLISEVKTRNLGPDFAWAATMRDRAASQLSLNTRKARSRARGSMVSLSRGGVASRARPDQHIQRQEKAAWITLLDAA